MGENWDVKYKFAPEDLPDVKTFTFTIIFFMMSEDMMFHLMHRLLHHRWLYPYVHKLHHEYKTTVGLAAEYSHPIDFFLTGIVPTTLAGVLLGKYTHIATVIAWNIARIFESIDGHCGYEFSWSPYRLIPFGASASYHDYHHSHNVGNYSSMLTFWDTVLGSNDDFHKFNEKEIALKKKNSEKLQ